MTKLYRVTATFEVEAEDEEDAGRVFEREHAANDGSTIIDAIGEIEECGSIPTTTSLP